jgi:hypothetical protein
VVVIESVDEVGLLEEEEAHLGLVSLPWGRKRRSRGLLIALWVTQSVREGFFQRGQSRKAIADLSFLSNHRPSSQKARGLPPFVEEDGNIRGQRNAALAVGMQEREPKTHIL